MTKKLAKILPGHIRFISLRYEMNMFNFEYIESISDLSEYFSGLLNMSYNSIFFEQKRSKASEK